MKAKELIEARRKPSDEVDPKAFVMKHADSMRKLWIVDYSHRHGHNYYLVRAAAMPEVDELLAKLGIDDFDEADEWIDWEQVDIIDL